MKYTYEKSFDYENGFYQTCDVYRLGNILVHYELYKKIINLPGAIVELGVFKGSSLLQFASFRELLENENSRRIIGFDAFGNFPCPPPQDNCNIKSDKDFIDNWNKGFADDFLSKDDLYAILQHKGISNVDLVGGDIMETLDAYVEAHPELRISLLHIDVDVYHPSKKALDTLFSRVVRGGLVVFDDYAAIEGETVAVEEFLDHHPEYILQKFPFSHVKPSFIVKK